MTAPWRVSVGLLKESQSVKLLAVHDRRDMDVSLKHAPCEPCSMLFTIFATATPRNPATSAARPAENEGAHDADQRSAPAVESARAEPSEPSAARGDATANPSSGSRDSQPQPPAGCLEGWAPPPTALHGPAFRQLTAQEKSDLIRLHNNLGHPSPESLAKHLAVAKASPHVVQAAKEFVCDACTESVQPRHQRPAKLHEVTEFNN